MYQNGFVACVKINGKTVEEKDGKVVIPFDSEYSLMLKNRNDRKALVRVYIDAEEVTEKGKLIIDANSSINLERYIDNMENGKKFKFVPISDNRVNDKNDPEKGFIEVRFQLVKPVLNNTIIHENHIYHEHHHGPYWRPWRWWWSSNEPYYTDCPIYNTTSKGLGATYASTNTGLYASYTCCNNIPVSAEDKGATIKGSDSNQKFIYSYVGELEAQETVIRFQIFGTRDENIVSQYCKTHCTSCGKAYDKNDNYCAKCGIKK